MFEAKRLWFFVIVVFASIILIECELNWTFDLIESKTINNTPDKLIIDINVTRISRGVFTLNGYMNMKEDLTDQSRGHLTVYYSFTGSNFIKSPYHIPDVNLSTALNNYYKEYFMETALSCTENAPKIVDKFIPPLTKRVIYLIDCPSTNEDMPPIMKTGYYILKFVFTNQVDSTLEVMVKVEPNY